MSNTPLKIAFEGGTLVLTGGQPDDYVDLPNVQYDPRTTSHRAEARYYRQLVEYLRKTGVKYEDAARGFDAKPMGWTLKSGREPFPHQQEAVDAWWKGGGRGVVVLPTGTGKTFVAVLAMLKTNRPALVVTWTIDLMFQWEGELRKHLGIDVGLMGGGEYNPLPVTVTTYDSAYLKVEWWGNKYGLLVFDEAHHLPGDSLMQAAICSIAPFRMGLTATPERADGRESFFPELIGDIVYRREIKELSGDYLAEYTARRIFVDLSPEEQEQYQRARDLYKAFLQNRGISLGGQNDWQRFLWEAVRSPEGWEAFQAFREQKRLQHAASAKLTKLEELLEQHSKDRVIIFTADNATVYQIARRFLVPAITHQTKSKERKQILARFHTGEYPFVVTSQVLNEGVDVPAASVGIVLSGTGTTRENVQRLGRLLRKLGDKQATLYEVIARGTSEEYTSDRRRQHHAFR